MVSMRRTNYTINSKNGCLNGLLMPGLVLGLLFASFVSLYISRLYFAIEHTDAVRQALLRYSEAETSYITTNSGSSSFKSTSSSSNTIPANGVANSFNGNIVNIGSTNGEEESPFDSEQRSETKLELIARIFPNETVIENPPLQDGATTFSACMLVMDDNHRLTEWMAYHYHVLPLRYMIVAVDPRSKTSPTHIFNQWRKRGVHIIEWNDRDFWRSDLKLLPIPDDAELQTKRDRHRGRQKYFYKQCLIRCKKDHRTWVSLHDSDEFLVYNHAGGDKYEEWETRRSKTSRMPRVKPSQTPPTTADAGAMIHYINQERAAGLKYYQSPCIGVPRTMFGADESQVDTNAIVKQVRTNFHWAAPLMDTLKYRQHATRNDFVKNALGKVIIDVSRVNVAKTPYFMSLHRPIKKLCPSPWINDWSAGLRINHYLGSWHSYSFRDDSRRGNERSWEQWTYKAMTLGENTDDNIRPWLSGLIENEGEEVAADMLQNVGLPANYKNGDDYRWHLIPERLHEILSTDITIKQDNKAVAFEDWVRQTYRKNPNLVEERKLDYAKVQAEMAASGGGSGVTTNVDEDSNETDHDEEELEGGDDNAEGDEEQEEPDDVDLENVDEPDETNGKEAGKIVDDHENEGTSEKIERKVVANDQDTLEENNKDEKVDAIEDESEVESAQNDDDKVYGAANVNEITDFENTNKNINDDEDDETETVDSKVGTYPYTGTATLDKQDATKEVWTQ